MVDFQKILLTQMDIGYIYFQYLILNFNLFTPTFFRSFNRSSTKLNHLNLHDLPRYNGPLFVKELPAHFLSENDIRPPSATVSYFRNDESTTQEHTVTDPLIHTTCYELIRTSLNEKRIPYAHYPYSNQFDSKYD